MKQTKLTAPTNQAIERLARTRQIEAEYKEEITEIEAELKANPLWGYLERRREFLRVAQVDVADAINDVRKAALTMFAETGDKSPHPAVKIKMYTVLEYSDSEALDYARQHLPKALKLDKRTFEKAAKAIEPEFVMVTQEARTTIARDLSQYLPAIETSLEEEK